MLAIFFYFVLAKHMPQAKEGASAEKPRVQKPSAARLWVAGAMDASPESSGADCAAGNRNARAAGAAKSGSDRDASAESAEDLE
jgi:hypothetical protein